LTSINLPPPKWVVPFQKASLLSIDQEGVTNVHMREQWP